MPVTRMPLDLHLAVVQLGRYLKSNMLYECWSEFWKVIAVNSEQIKTILDIATMGIAIYALNLWKFQLKGTAEYKLAKDLLKAVYRVREAFKHVRHPAIWEYEYPEGMRGRNGAAKEENKHEAHEHAYNERFKVLDEAFRNLEDLTLDAQVEWGLGFVNVMPLRKCRSELLITILRYLSDLKNPTEQCASTAAENKHNLQVMYYLEGSKSGPDEFTKEINSAIMLYENCLRPIIGKAKA